MPNVLIISEVKGFYLKVIREKLQELSYEVFTIQADTDAINDFKEHIYGILIYADDKLISQQQALNYIKDKAIADDIPIFLIGDYTELTAIKKIIPVQIILQEFARPIDILKVISKIHEFLQRQNMQKKILAVDDSGTMLRNIKGWLEDKYNVFLANSAAMAIKYLSLNRPDLVLLDYEMPIVDGRQVLEMMRTEIEFADIPVIILTGHDNKEYFVNIQGLKPDGYLLKTMEPAQIRKSIDDFFLKRKAFI